MVREIPESIQPVTALPIPMTQANILIVDDLPANLMVYRNILDELGQNILLVSSGEEALKMVLKQEFAVILLDVNMPTMNGFETASLIRKRKKSAHTPIIFMTAFTDEMHMIQGYASGAVDYLPTPIVPEVLKAKVRVFIELSQMRRQAALQAEERVRREAAEESAQKSAFLAKLSESLARAQGQEELLGKLVQLSVPHLADVAFAWLKDDEAHVDRSICSVSNNVVDSDLPFILSQHPWLESVVKKVVASGHLQVLDEIPAQKLPGLLDGVHSILALPLQVKGHIVGAMVLARRHAQVIYQPKDICLADDMAYRAGLALENVMLVERIQEADRRKDEFLGMLAHELRNPLGPIYNSLQLQKMLGPEDPRRSDLQDIIERQAKHMGRLIDDLLDATRLAHGKILLRKESFDLTKVVRQTVDDYRNVVGADGMHLHFESTDKPIWVDGDPTRLVQAIGNLLHNAHKYSKRDGDITVQLTTEDIDSKAKLVVKDTGIGIDPVMLRCVFDVFRQAEQGLDRSRGGLGLGLALVKGLVELHGGEVSADSEGLGKGAAFAIKLPTIVAQRRASPVIPLRHASTYKKYTILVIEDNHDAAESIRMLLAQEGHEVRMAYTANEGLSIASDFRPQVILCDIGLPVIDGYQVIQTIRQDPVLSSAYVIALTGYGREKDQRRALDAGFDLHLTKPVNYDGLRQVLANISFAEQPGGEGYPCTQSYDTTTSTVAYLGG
jgi:signal transduction histidine kinase/DNA-binding response OmpR family regulator